MALCRKAGRPLVFDRSASAGDGLPEAAGWSGPASRPLVGRGFGRVLPRHHDRGPSYPATVWATVFVQSCSGDPGDRGWHHHGRCRQPHLNYPSQTSGTVNMTILGDGPGRRSREVVVMAVRRDDPAGPPSRLDWRYDHPQDSRDDLGHRPCLTVDTCIFRPIWWRKLCCRDDPAR